MVQQVGIRELKNEASEIIRAVREERAEYVVTYRGQPVAVILPVDESSRAVQIGQLLAASRPNDDFWARLNALVVRSMRNGLATRPASNWLLSKDGS